MHAHPEPYVGQPSPGATIPAQLAADPSHDNGELPRYLRARPAGTLTPRFIDLSELPEPFTLRECQHFAGWYDNEEALSDALVELGYMARLGRLGDQKVVVWERRK